VRSAGESHRAGRWTIENVADDTGESTNLDESLNARARKNRREKNSESLHQDSPDSLDSPNSLAPHDSPRDTDSDSEVFEGTSVPFPPALDLSPAERGGDNDGWWEHVMETAGRVSPDVDDEPALDETYADVLVTHGDDDYEEDAV
jgi:hypothetical protein